MQDKTVSAGVITIDPEVDDQIPTINNAPADSDSCRLKQTTQKKPGRTKRSVFNNVVDKLKSNLYNFTTDQFLSPKQTKSVTKVQHVKAEGIRNFR